MSWFVNFASSSVVIRSWSCLDVFLFAMNLFWLSCRIWCFFPYADSMDVKVFVNNLYTVFASAIGLEGSLFCKILWLGLSSRKLVFVVCNNGRIVRNVYCGSFWAYFLGLCWEFYQGRVFCCLLDFLATCRMLLCQIICVVEL